MNKNVDKWVLPLITVSVIAATSVIFNLTQAFSKDFAKGQRQFKQENYHVALSYFLSASNRKPSDRNTLKYLTASYNKLNRNEDVLKQLEKLQQIDKKDFETILWMADIHYSLGNFQKAENLYQRVLSNSKTPVVQMKLAEVLAWQEKYSQAIYILRKLPENPQSTELLADIYAWGERYSEAIDLYGKLVSVEHVNPDIILKLADTLRFAKRDKEAIVIYRKYIQEYNES